MFFFHCQNGVHRNTSSYYMPPYPRCRNIGHFETEIRASTFSSCFIHSRRRCKNKYVDQIYTRFSSVDQTERYTRPIPSRVPRRGRECHIAETPETAYIYIYVVVYLYNVMYIGMLCIYNIYIHNIYIQSDSKFICYSHFII